MNQLHNQFEIECKNKLLLKIHTKCRIESVVLLFKFFQPDKHQRLITFYLISLT